MLFLKKNGDSSNLTIAIDPYLYPAVDDIRDGYRRSVCGVDNIYYRVVVGGVEIVRILGRQDTKDLP